MPGLGMLLVHGPLDFAPEPLVDEGFVETGEVSPLAALGVRNLPQVGRVRKDTVNVLRRQLLTPAEVSRLRFPALRRVTLGVEATGKLDKGMRLEVAGEDFPDKIGLFGKDMELPILTVSRQPIPQG